MIGYTTLGTNDLGKVTEFMTPYLPIWASRRLPQTRV